MRSALAICLLTRAALVVVAWAGLVLAPFPADDIQWRYFPDNLWADGWCRWDSGWYYPIADKGYQNRPNARNQRDTSFFPLYPLLMRVGALAADGDLMYGGLLVSNLAFLVGGMAVYAWGRRKLGPEAARRGLILLCVYPFSVFYGAVYTESLFLACAALAFLFAEREDWLLAALFGSCAAVTRIPGILVGLALAVLYWEKHRRLRASFLFLLLVPALPLGHIAMLRHNFGDPFPFLSGASAWREPRLLDAFGSFLQRDPFESSMYALQFGLFAAACGACVLALRRLGLAYGLWCSLHLLVSLKAPFLGMGRFTSVLFPLFVVGGQALSRGLFWSWTLLSAALLGLTTYGFSHWLPVM